jgi:putative glycosyltransferase (TIGR04348 family)
MSNSNPVTLSIVTPAPAGSQNGNRLTALRWSRILKKLGYHVHVLEKWQGWDADLLIALHAYRSHDSILDFHQKYPNKPIVLVLTGTDLYRDLNQHPEVLASMTMADCIVVLQPAALQLIPQHLHEKTRVVYQSVKAIGRKPRLKKQFLVSVIGHLRPEKDPFCTVRSLNYLPQHSTIIVKHLGKAMSVEMEQKALHFESIAPRYEWLKELKHSKALQKLARSHLMVISSLMEGGAHVVSEAIALGVPVIASDIPGNRGLLGDDYSGYYPTGNEIALAAVLDRAETDENFYTLLEQQVISRQHLVHPDFEKQSLQHLIKDLLIINAST